MRQERIPEFGGSVMQEWREWLPEIHARDLLVAASLLTRFPTPASFDTGSERIAGSSWAWPVIGAIVGLVAGIAGASLGWLGIDRGLAAIAALGVLVLLTGAMHEDGLADTLDGLAGGSTSEKRLAIMKDSHIGVFGATGLALVLLGRWSAMSELGGLQLIAVLLTSSCASRLPVVLAMTVLPPARESGLSASIGRPSGQIALLATAVTAIACLAALGVAGLAAVFIAFVGAVPVCFLARQLIGGQTGDVLGASQQFAELAVLAMLASIIQ